MQGDLVILIEDSGENNIELNEFLTVENAKGYASTNDKLIYCQDITNFPLRSKKLEHFEYEMWMFACNLGLCREID